MVSKVLSKSTFILWIWVYAISISTLDAKDIVETHTKDESAHPSPNTHEIEEEPLLSVHEHIKPAVTTHILPHLYGHKIMLGAMAMNRLIWYGPDDTFLQMKKDFEKITTKKGWTLSNWFKSTKHEDWDQQLLNIFDLNLRVANEQDNVSDQLMQLLSSSYKSIPSSEKKSYGQTAYVVYANIGKLYQKMVNENWPDYFKLYIRPFMNARKSGFRPIRLSSYISSPKAPSRIDADPQRSVPSNENPIEAFVEMNCYLLEEATIDVLLNFRHVIDALFDALKKLILANKFNRAVRESWRWDLNDAHNALNENGNNMHIIRDTAELLTRVFSEKKHLTNMQCQNLCRQARSVLQEMYSTADAILTYFERKLKIALNKHNVKSQLLRLFQR